MSIEANIHYIWMGGEIPAPYRKGISFTEMINPDYNVKVHDLGDILPVLEEHAPVLAKFVDTIQIPAAISDIARLALIYAYGGWYVDTDTVPRVAIDYWANSGHEAYIFSRIDNSKLIVQNSLLGAKAGHPVFLHALRVIERLLESRQYNYSVYSATGPIALIAAVSPFVSEPKVYFDEMDYSLVNVIGGGTKGSWTYQENCGILMSQEEPPVFNPHSSLDRIGSVEAWRFYRKVFDMYPETRQRNYVRLLERLGVHHVHKKKLKGEVLELAQEFLPIEDHEEFYRKLVDELSAQGDAPLGFKYGSMLSK